MERSWIRYRMPVLFERPPCQRGYESRRRFDDKGCTVKTNVLVEHLDTNADHLVQSDTEDNEVVMSMVTLHVRRVLQQLNSFPSMWTAQPFPTVTMVDVGMHTAVERNDEGGSFLRIESAVRADPQALHNILV